MTMSANVLSSLLLVARLSWKCGVKAVVVSVYWSKSDADLCQEGYGFISFSLLAGLPKNCSSNNHKLCEKVAHGPRKKPLHVGGNPDHVMGTSHAPQTWPHFEIGHVTNFEILGPPFISLEWPKVETSYLVHTLTMTCIIQCTTNWPLKKASSGSRDLNLKLVAPP